jgi:hypothetical protein
MQHASCWLADDEFAGLHPCQKNPTPAHLQLPLLHWNQLCFDVRQLLLAACGLAALLTHAQGAEVVLIIAWHLLQAYAGKVVYGATAVAAQHIALQCKQRVIS